jgi:hypothetical protein
MLYLYIRTTLSPIMVDMYKTLYSPGPPFILTPDGTAHTLPVGY